MTKSIHVTALLRSLGLTVLLAFGATAIRAEGQQNLKPSSAAGDNGSAAFEGMIEGLSSNTFNTRQTSFDQLVAAGSLAVSVLEEGAKSDQLEVATRCVEALTLIAGDPKAVKTALPALERLAEDATARIAAIAGARVKELKTTEQERAIAKLTSLGASVDRATQGNARSVSIHNDRQAYYLQFLPHLRSISMRGKDITDAAIRPILSLELISFLSISDASITDRGLRELKKLSKISFLSLRGTEFSADGIRHLNDFPSLRTLSFEPASPDQLQILEGITKLDSLSLSNVVFDQEAAAVLNRLGAIRSIKLQVSAIDDAHWEWMSMTKVPVEISIMRVKDVSDAGWKNLSRAKIVELAAYDTALEDNSIRHLSNIKELESLTITNADITDAGMAHLQGHEKLVSIRLKGTKVTKDGIAKLGKAMPSLLRVSLNGERLLNRRAPSISYTVSPITGGQNAHLRGAITPEIVKKLKQTPDLSTVFLGSSETYDEQQLKLLADVPIKKIFVRSAKFSDRAWSAVEDYPTLESISLGRILISRESAQAIGRIRSLKSLTISYTDFSDDVVKELIGALAEAGTIEKVNFYRCKRITNAAFSDIGKLASLSQFRSSNNPGITSLVLNEVGKLPNLTSLSLRDLRFDQSDLARLSSTKKLTVLQITPQEQVTLSKKSLDALRQLPSLESLTMNNVSISPERIGLLGKIHTLRKLTLNDSNITDESIGAMRGLSNLEELSLRDTNIGDDGVAAISKQFSKLTHLSLARTSITDAALDHINAIENLEQLAVEWTKISGGELRRLTDLGKLKQISIGDKQIGEQDESQFKRDHPSISLVILR